VYETLPTKPLSHMLSVPIPAVGTDHRARARAAKAHSISGIHQPSDYIRATMWILLLEADDTGCCLSPKDVGGRWHYRAARSQCAIISEPGKVTPTLDLDLRGGSSTQESPANQIPFDKQKSTDLLSLFRQPYEKPTTSGERAELVPSAISHAHAPQRKSIGRSSSCVDICYNRPSPCNCGLPAAHMPRCLPPPPQLPVSRGCNAILAEKLE
jgi:hypothetical protein